LGIARYIVKPPDLETFLQIGTVLKEILLQSQVGSAGSSERRWRTMLRALPPKGAPKSSRTAIRSTSSTTRAPGTKAESLIDGGLGCETIYEYR
jgi:hypothetical protein